MIGHNRLGSNAYTNSTPKANLAAEAAKEFSNPPPAIVQAMVTYESIKAKIDGGIAKQSFGRQEVAEGLKQMMETKAYTKKYKTIAAFAEHEYGKSARWISHMLAEFIPADAVDKSESEAAPTAANKHDKKESVALKQVEQAREEKEEEERPAVHSADEVKREESKPANNGQNGKPKHSLAIWNELETSLGRSLNRADELNRMCPNRIMHIEFIEHAKACMDILTRWKEKI